MKSSAWASELLGVSDFPVRNWTGVDGNEFLGVENDPRTISDL